MRPDGPRDPVAGPDAGPQSPYPIRIDGKVVKGFGRGSKELGIPTANIPISGLTVGGHDDLESGIYYGYAGLSSGHKKNGDTEAAVYEMVMSIGWNPYYKNEVRSVEVHIMHDFEHDFYDSHMNLVILGYIRPEYDYVSKESLIEDIRTDIDVARQSLERPAYKSYRDDTGLVDFKNKTDVAS